MLPSELRAHVLTPGAMLTHPRRLRPYNGLVPSKPLLLAIKGRVLDVREGAEYYGPDGPYKIMAGCDASKAFAMMSLKAEDAHDDLTGVDDTHLKILDDWYEKLTQKYPTVGRMVVDETDAKAAAEYAERREKQRAPPCMHTLTTAPSLPHRYAERREKLKSEALAAAPAAAQKRKAQEEKKKAQEEKAAEEAAEKARLEGERGLG